MQNRRTSKEVREDVKKIMLQSDAATTFIELARFSGLSYSQLMTTLSQFPNLKRTISEKLKNNSIQKQYSLGYVIDASILNVSTQVLNQIIDDNNTIICLNTTIKELDEIHKTGKDENSKKAHFLMLKILYEQEHFAVIDYRKAHSIKPDDVIIAYCKENKHRAVLLTADKNMALKARASKILVQYYTPSEILPNGIKRLENGDVIADTTCSKDSLIRVISSTGKIYENSSKPIILKEGDELYIATRVRSYIHFEHYQILDDDGGNNLLFKKNIGFSKEKIKKLPNREYRSFLEEFKTRYDRKYVR